MHLLKFTIYILGFFFALILVTINDANASECLQAQTIFVDTDNDALTPNESIQIFKSSTTCDGFLLTQQELDNLQLDATNINYELLGLTPELIAQVFGFGFGAVIFFWSLGYAVGVGTGVIKKV
jgi:hypothetical protein